LTEEGFVRNQIYTSSLMRSQRAGRATRAQRAGELHELSDAESSTGTGAEELSSSPKGVRPSDQTGDHGALRLIRLKVEKIDNKEEAATKM